MKKFIVFLLFASLPGSVLFSQTPNRAGKHKAQQEIKAGHHLEKQLPHHPSRVTDTSNINRKKEGKKKKVTEKQHKTHRTICIKKEKKLVEQ